MISLPELVWVKPGLAVAIVPGEPYTSLTITPPFHENPDPIVLAPQELAQYDKPCETCAVGNNAKFPAGRVFALGFGPDGIRCPEGIRGRCRDGRQVWEVRWAVPVFASEDVPSQSIKAGDQVGVSPVDGLSARAILRVVPVVSAAETSGHDGLHVCIQGNTAILNDGSKFVCVLPLDPLPVVGQDFILVVNLYE